MTATAPRIVCISGGTSGIGAGLVAAFVEAGDRVVTFGRDPEKVAALAQQRSQAAHSGALRLLVGDVTHADFRARLVAEIRDTDGRLDVLVNNAGYGLYGPVEEIGLDEARYQFESMSSAPPA